MSAGHNTVLHCSHGTVAEAQQPASSLTVRSQRGRPRPRAHLLRRYGKRLRAGTAVSQPPLQYACQPSEVQAAVITPCRMSGPRASASPSRSSWRTRTPGVRRAKSMLCRLSPRTQSKVYMIRQHLGHNYLYPCDDVQKVGIKVTHELCMNAAPGGPSGVSNALFSMLSPPPAQPLHAAAVGPRSSALSAAGRAHHTLKSCLIGRAHVCNKANQCARHLSRRQPLCMATMVG